MPPWRCKPGTLLDTFCLTSSFSFAGVGPGRIRIAEIVRPSPQVHELAFSGIHVISPRLLTMMDEDGAFSIIASYVNLAARGERIVGFRADEYYWRDLGRPENVAQAAGFEAKALVAGSERGKMSANLSLLPGGEGGHVGGRMRGYLLTSKLYPLFFVPTAIARHQ